VLEAVLPEGVAVGLGVVKLLNVSSRDEASEATRKKKKETKQQRETEGGEVRSERKRKTTMTKQQQ
jgi:hypothetical protein